MASPVPDSFPHRPPRSSTEGFTLMELMVAISVLVLLCGLVMQLMGSATRLTGNARQTADCDSQARFALSQISQDLARRIRRPDVDAAVCKSTGDDQFYFFSETPGYAPGISNPTDVSPVSLVGYRVTHRTNKNNLSTFQLERCAMALPWNDNVGGIRSLPFVALDRFRQPIPSTTLGGVDGKGNGGTFEGLLSGNTSQQVYFQELASNVLRFEVALLLKPGIYLADPQNPSPAPPPAEVAQLPPRLMTDAEMHRELARHGFTRIAAVVVSLAVVDSRSMAQVGMESLLSVSKSLVDAQPTSYPRLPIDAWNETFQAQSAGWPKPVAAGLRFYQRIIQLH